MSKSSENNKQMVLSVFETKYRASRRSSRKIRQSTRAVNTQDKKFDIKDLITLNTKDIINEYRYPFAMSN
jgi:hypothetical protein